jgi:hypothetical protein
MLHPMHNGKLYYGTPFKCAVCHKFGIFIFYPQIHEKCYKKEFGVIKMRSIDMSDVWLGLFFLGVLSIIFLIVAIGIRILR